MTSNIALFSVLFLAVIVAIAFWRKCNIGILDKLCTDAAIPLRTLRFLPW